MADHLISAVNDFPDKRIGQNITYSMKDIGMGAFSVFFNQSLSFLSFQKSMEQSKGKSNAQTIFDIDKIPSDNHIRDISDPVHPSYVFPVFRYIVRRLNESGYLEQFRFIDDKILIALDGT